MQSEKQVRLITVVLGAVAGFCDTLTFTSANGLFSAHITGNFILFAGRLVHTSDLLSWVRLLAFPVFVLSIITGGWIGRRKLPAHTLLQVEGLLLCAAGLFAFLIRLDNQHHYESYMYLVALTIVFAMGLQNAYGKLFTAETFGPTTAMTGNVTQWALDIGRLLGKGQRDPVVLGRFRRQSFLIIGFFLGCLAGAVAGRFIGLSAVLVAGLTLLLYLPLSGTNSKK